jgi:hypothetical protein
MTVYLFNTSSAGFSSKNKVQNFFFSKYLICLPCGNSSKYSQINIIEINLEINEFLFGYEIAFTKQC